jgi:hypothetical protein
MDTDGHEIIIVYIETVEFLNDSLPIALRTKSFLSEFTRGTIAESDLFSMGTPVLAGGWNLTSPPLSHSYPDMIPI